MSRVTDTQLDTRAGKGLVAGMLLGLAVVGTGVVLPQAGLNGAENLKSVQSLAVSSSAEVSTTNVPVRPGPAGPGQAHGPPGFASQLGSLSQSPASWLPVMLPVLAALFFGAIAYGVTRTRNGDEG